ncbi:hypothetical protein [Spirosoma validum]|uniref:BclA C-terminal domain-containing protein n=1 Tax=Spirosoma validum TaxID=2771355 RepID=A0A927B1X2_9BACT|nr:hypothetical protein [Spirosoma validum]MBD2753752.1 hypothetical protein [Spirosoma validum]
MKNHLLTPLLLLLTITAYAQVGIGTIIPDPSAQLDVVSTQRGLLPPRMSAQQRTNIPNPVEGLMVYQNESPLGYYLFKQGSWQRLVTEAELTAAIVPSYAFAQRVLPADIANGALLDFPDFQQLSSDITLNPAGNSVFTFSRPGLYHVTYTIVLGGSNLSLVAEYNGVEIPGGAISSIITTQIANVILNVTGSYSTFAIRSKANSRVYDAHIEIKRL